MKVRHLLPDEYGSLFETSCLDFDLHETKATCEACAKSKPQYKKNDDYLPHLKCCTYQPFLPNYAVGALLSDSTGRYAQAQSVLRKQILNREYALPIGILPSVKYQVGFQKNKKKIFGRDQNYLCPYFDQEKNCCGIWKYRGSVCTSFYCMSSYGQSGQNFWKALRRQMSYAEMLLMEEVLVHLDFSPRQISRQIEYLDRKTGTVTELKSHRMSQPLFESIWTDRADQVESFYIQCYKLMKKIRRKEFVEVAGEMGLQIEKDLIRQMNLLKVKKND